MVDAHAVAKELAILSARIKRLEDHGVAIMAIFAMLTETLNHQDVLSKQMVIGALKGAERGARQAGASKDSLRFLGNLRRMIEQPTTPPGRTH